MDKQEILKALIWRSAIKIFDENKKITSKDFQFLLDVAKYSPSSFGLEPWEIIVIQNKEIRELIAPYATGAQKQLKSASHFIIFTVKKDLLPTSEYFKHINIDIKGMDETAYDNFVSTFAAFSEMKQQLTNQRERIDWAGKQCYLALGNMITAAALIGIDSCPIEGFIASDVESVLEKYGKFDSNSNKIVVMGAFGYRLENPKHAKVRRDISEIVQNID